MRALGLVGLLIALGIGYFVYMQQAQSTASVGGGSPQAVIDLVGVKSDLISFANAERQQLALEGKYLPIEELRAKGMAVPGDTRGPYSYTADVSDRDFRITATYDGPTASGAPAVLSIGPTGQVE
jgi:hypothetical protein